MVLFFPALYYHFFGVEMKSNCIKKLKTMKIRFHHHRFNIHLKSPLKKIYSFENIFSNQWILIYPLQAVPAIICQLLSKLVRPAQQRRSG